MVSIKPPKTNKALPSSETPCHGPMTYCLPTCCPFTREPYPKRNVEGSRVNHPRTEVRSELLYMCDRPLPGFLAPGPTSQRATADRILIDGDFPPTTSASRRGGCGVGATGHAVRCGTWQPHLAGLLGRRECRFSSHTYTHELRSGMMLVFFLSCCCRRIDDHIRPGLVGRRKAFVELRRGVSFSSLLDD
ncbi:hypothetical protein VTJ04DRAFT_6099 [Mycothermus thermophilus]|uniref:uncharacterized protein n=1 Tax=Humicola insolens TaxID=85995 RepID=UPI0037423402